MRPGYTLVLWALSCIICCNALPEGLAGRKLLQDLEGFSIDSIGTYLKYVDKKCGDPAKAKGECLSLKNELCGTGSASTAEILCCGAADVCALPGKIPVAKFRSASRYTRVGYLKCSLISPTCTTDTEGFTGGWWFGYPADPPPADIDPRSLNLFSKYVNCSMAFVGTTKPNTCTLTKELCSRPDVKCEGKKVTFYETTKNVKRRRAIFVAKPERYGLLDFVRQPQTKPAASQPAPGDRGTQPPAKRSPTNG